MAERDVVVRLRVKPENGKAFDDMAKKAKAAEESVNRVGKAVTAAGRGGAGGGTGGTGGGVGFAEGLKAWAAVEVTTRSLEGLAKAAESLGNSSLSTTKKVQSLLESIPFFGGAAAATRELVDAATGRTERRRQDALNAKTLQEQGEVEQLGTRFFRQRVGVEQSAATAGLADEAKLEKQKALALADQQDLKARIANIDQELAANKGMKGEGEVLQALQREIELLKLRGGLLEEIRGSETKVLDIVRSRAETEKKIVQDSQRSFGGLSATDKLASLQASKQLRDKGIGSLTEDQKGLLGRVGIFGEQLSKGAQESAARDPLFRQALAQSGEGGDVAKAALSKGGPLDDTALAGAVQDGTQKLVEAITASIRDLFDTSAAQLKSQNQLTRVLAQQQQ